MNALIKIEIEIKRKRPIYLMKISRTMSVPRISWDMC